MKPPHNAKGQYSDVAGCNSICRCLYLGVVLCGVVSAQASGDYYYYNGRKIFLQRATDVTAAKIQAAADATKYSYVTEAFNLAKSASDLVGDTVLFSRQNVSPAQASRVLSSGMAAKEIFKIPVYQLGSFKLILQNDLIVQFKDTVTEQCRTALHFPDQHVPDAYQRHLLKDFSIKSARIVTTPGLFRAVVGNPESTLGAANTINGNCTVRYAVPNFVILLPPALKQRWRSPVASARVTDALGAIGPLSPPPPPYPNDPFFPQQWNLENVLSSAYGKSKADIRIRGAWEVTKGSEQIRVAVLDDGVDVDHPDLAGSIAKENGQAVQWDFIADTASQKPAPGDHHGTWTAGVIASQIHNGIGLSGVAPYVKIVPIRMGSGEGQPTTWTTPVIASQAIKKAVELKADVINASWGVAQFDAIEDAIKDATTNGRNKKGAVIVFAAGDNGGALAYPASLAAKYPVIAVGATNSWDQVKDRQSNDLEYWASNQGPALTIVAPGVGIVTTDVSKTPPEPHGSYIQAFNGTSASAPQVAGVAALLLSVHGGL